MEYRNVRHGRIVTRPAVDDWLEASAGWERVAPSPVDELLDADDLAVIAAEDDTERMDDDGWS